MRNAKYFFQNIFVLAMAAFLLSSSNPYALAEQKSANTGNSSSQTSATSGSVSMGGGEDWDPFEEMNRMQAEMRQFFDSLIGRDYNFQFTSAPRTSLDFNPDYDLVEEPKSYHLTMDLPGMQKEEIDIQLKNNLLTIAGKRDATEEKTQDQGEGKVYYRSRSFGSFQTAVQLPDNIKEDGIQAKYENGVLQVTIPKAEPKMDEAAQKIAIT